MNILWQEIVETHADLFVVDNWQECSGEKIKAWRLPVKYSYFIGGNTTLRAGIIASDVVPREEEFLLAGLQWGNRLSNGVKTILYFIAPNFSPYFLQSITKIGGNVTTRAIYWREKLIPSLYLIPEKPTQQITRYHMGDERPDWQRWSLGLNPVACQQVEIIRSFFESLQPRQVRSELKNQTIVFLRGDLEIAEIVRKGRKVELLCKTKWEKNYERAVHWQKAGWVDFTGQLNSEFRETIHEILEYLELNEKKAAFSNTEMIRLLLYQGGGIVSTLWGERWKWPWMPKERSEQWITELGHWFYFHGNGQLSVVQPILDHSIQNVTLSLLLTSVLENSVLLKNAKNNEGEVLYWDQRVHWLTSRENEEELCRYHYWLKNPEQFPIWVLPDDWRTSGLYELSNRMGILQGETE